MSGSGADRPSQLRLEKLLQECEKLLQELVLDLNFRKSRIDNFCQAAQQRVLRRPSEQNAAHPSA